MPALIVSMISCAVEVASPILSLLSDPVAVLWAVIALAAFVAAAVYLWIGLRL